jgi:hypothetical protein
MIAEFSYTTQLQAGLGMTSETLDLLHLWQRSDDATRLTERVVASGLFSRATARRARNLVVEMFAPRFLAQNGVPAARMKFLAERKFPTESLVQLFFLYTARAQAIFRDFVTDVYWSRYSAHAPALSRDDAELFVRRALDTGRMQKRWADSTIRRVSAYLLGCCADFGLLGKAGRSQRAIKHFVIRSDVAVYLAHDLHFAGLSDMAMATDPDWRLFGLDPQDVIKQLKSMAHDGHFFIQATADVIQVSWKYRAMEDCLNALTQG